MWAALGGRSAELPAGGEASQSSHGPPISPAPRPAHPPRAWPEDPGGHPSPSPRNPPTHRPQADTGPPLSLLSPWGAQEGLRSQQAAETQGQGTQATPAPQGGSPPPCPMARAAVSRARSLWSAAAERAIPGGKPRRLPGGGERALGGGVGGSAPQPGPHPPGLRGQRGPGWTFRSGEAESEEKEEGEPTPREAAGPAGSGALGLSVGWGWGVPSERPDFPKEFPAPRTGTQPRMPRSRGAREGGEGNGGVIAGRKASPQPLSSPAPGLWSRRCSAPTSEARSRGPQKFKRPPAPRS